MKHLAIKAENISKQYRLGQVGTGTLSHDINRFWSKIRGLEDPYLKIGDTNDRSTRGESDYVWSLRDINFEIEQGDAVGIIGRNGAGKSTLLKLLSKVTKPTTGNFKVNGRIASLLEVGTGFNPEMTGRENIYLNGAILGMRRQEITRKLDEIIAFSGVERYIDTPVKRYSSGMYVRLAFAVAAHLESEILIVDEVLAVGDYEFQKKCLGKMGDVSKGEGRTVLFVSHNLMAVNALCNKGLMLNNGHLVADGVIEDVLRKYKSQNNQNSLFYINENVINGITKVNINTSTGTEVHEYGKELTIDIEAVFKKDFKNLALAFQIISEDEKAVINPLVVSEKILWVKDGVGKISCVFKKPRLYEGRYSLTFYLGDKSNNEHIQTLENACSFLINMDSLYSEYGWQKNNAVYMEDYVWKTKNEIYENNY